MPFRKQFSFIRRQHSFKLRSTFQELDKENDLVFTRRDLRRGEVSGLLMHSLCSCHEILLLASDQAHQVFKCCIRRP